MFPATVKPPYVGIVPSYTWSVLASLNPYPEQTSIYNQMDLEKPIYTLPSLTVTTENQFAVQQTVAVFLCVRAIA